MVKGYARKMTTDSAEEASTRSKGPVIKYVYWGVEGIPKFYHKIWHPPPKSVGKYLIPPPSKEMKCFVPPPNQSPSSQKHKILRTL